MIAETSRKQDDGYRRYRRVDSRRKHRRPVIVLVMIMAVILGLGGWLISSRRPDANATAAPELSTTSAPDQQSPEAQPTTAAAAPPVFTSLAFPAVAPSPAAMVKLPTLMFHHVGPTPPGADKIRTGLTVSGADFEAMMSYLKQAGYHPVSQTQLFRALFAGEPLPAHPVLLTFDDGYDDNAIVAAPIMAKYGFTGTFYIITDKVGTAEYMTWDQVTGLEKQGMEIGSHTCGHLDLTNLSGADLKHELADSAAAIASHLGHPVYWLCYPAGKYDADVTHYAREAGYLLAVTTKPGEQHSSDAPFAISRYRVRSDTGLAGFKELVR
ncbi:MAG: polysaccharide deacetylase family protein [Thermoleophilia bacterium]